MRLVGSMPNGGEFSEDVRATPEDHVAGTDEDGAPVAGLPVDAVLRTWERLRIVAPDAVWRVQVWP